MRKFLGIVFWSVLAAAFIGPGTVTTAAKAGHGHGFALLWALAFSTFACILLQEAAARVTVASGVDLGRALRRRFDGTRWSAPVVFVVVGAILVGCAAYEMGNILGAVAGVGLVADLPVAAVTLAIGAVAFALLWFGSARAVAHCLAVLVALMGVVFLGTAVGLKPDVGDVLRGVFIPTLPAGSALLVVALVGTTVVPYNLFLGSGIAAGQELRELRIGIAVAVGLGGVISMGVLVVGTAIVGEFGFDGVARALDQRASGMGRSLFAAGLFAAGVSSAVTAPLAAAITARSLFTDGDAAVVVASEKTPLYRGVWIAVLAAGVAFACLGLKPVPAIVFAQAMNGLLLPLVAVFLWVVVNDVRVMGEARSGRVANLLMGLVIVVTIVLGATNLWKAFESARGLLGGGATPVSTEKG